MHLSLVECLIDWSNPHFMSSTHSSFTVVPGVPSFVEDLQIEHGLPDGAPAGRVACRMPREEWDPPQTTGPMRIGPIHIDIRTLGISTQRQEAAFSVGHSTTAAPETRLILSMPEYLQLHLLNLTTASFEIIKAQGRRKTRMIRRRITSYLIRYDCHNDVSEKQIQCRAAALRPAAGTAPAW